MNELEIRKAIALLKPNDALFEVRLIAGRWNASGYFTDADMLVAELKKVITRKKANVYITLNEIKQDCYSRNQRDKFIENATPTTSDSDISLLEWLMIDIDPKRAAGTSSSDEQIGKAKQTANKVFSFLRRNGFEDPVVAMSGNGVHLLYAIGLSNNAENVSLLRSCLLALSMMFSDEQVEIDLKTFNPARICKLYGTKSQKGSDTAERPHRMSEIVRTGEQKQTDKKVLQWLSGLLPKEEKPERYNGYNPRAFDLDEWIIKHGLRVKKSSWNGGSKWVFEECPFNPEHKGKDAAIVQMPDGKIGFNCFHNSCAEHTWRDLRLLYEPNAYDRKPYEQKPYPNHQQAEYQPPPIQDIKPKDGEPIFLTFSEIVNRKRQPKEFIKTGVAVIDKKMRGLQKGYVSCMSGLRASGKSSLVTQFTIEAAQQGYRTALFSGELTDEDLCEWTLLQAAGRFNVQQTKYDNFYSVKETVKTDIVKWLDDKVYVYNNDYGNNFNWILEQISARVQTHKVDLVILDNMMALNLTMLDQNIFRQQSLFVEALENYAKAANIHIVFVAHPRKSNGFLRLDDVSGSNDIVNRVDNAFIVHRVNEDFKRLTHDMFKWSKDSEIYQCSNVVEVCKDRAGGTQDEFIPLFFDVTCKRLQNDEFENKVYGWQNEKEKVFEGLELLEEGAETPW